VRFAAYLQLTHSPHGGSDSRQRSDCAIQIASRCLPTPRGPCSKRL